MILVRYDRETNLLSPYVTCDFCQNRIVDGERAIFILCGVQGQEPVVERAPRFLHFECLAPYSAQDKDFVSGGQIETMTLAALVLALQANIRPLVPGAKPLVLGKQTPIEAPVKKKGKPGFAA